MNSTTTYMVFYLQEGNHDFN
uniref:Uncharacterized protein n=1 Tax=Arundo donax TaxID=35708 RepID=A0A0A9HY87_ARUDO